MDTDTDGLGMEIRPGSEPAQQLTPELKYRLLLHIAEQVSGTLELEEVLNLLVDTARGIVAYDAAGIYILSRAVAPLKRGTEANLLAGMALRGFELSNSENERVFKFGQGIVGKVIRTGESVIAHDVERDPNYVPVRPETRSEITVPLTRKGEVIGALNLESDRLGAYSEEDVQTLQFFAGAAVIALERAILHSQLVEKQRIEDQLRIAREVQSSLLPGRPPALPGYEFAAMNLPTYETGGDCYDYVEFPTGHVGFTIADVSGKGVPAALIMATFRAALRTQVRIDHDLAHIMQSVNKLLLESIGDTAFVTAVYGVLAPDSGWFVYSNCGHNPPLLLDGQGVLQRLNCGGPALGVFADVPIDSGAVQLDPGSTLVLYTDGVIEITDEEGREFGEVLLEKAMRDTQSLPAEQTVREVIDQTQAFAVNESYPDDFTIVVIKRRPV